MPQQQFYVPKESGTLSDTLLAFGLADLLAKLLAENNHPPSVKLSDKGAWYVVDAGVPIQDAWIKTTGMFELAPYLVGGKTTLPDELRGIKVRSVDDEWDAFRQYAEQRRLHADNGLRSVELEQAVADLAPKPDWTVTTYLGDYRMVAQQIYNSLVAMWWLTGSVDFALNLRTVLGIFATPDVDREAVIQNWNEQAGSPSGVTVTASQLFNPHMGKGQNRAKANKLTMGNEKAFWLTEFLKVVGLWHATAPAKVSNADLRKTYVLSPSHIDYEDHRRIFDRFRSRLRNAEAAKQDIIASLLYTEVLLEHAVEEDCIDIFGDGPVSNVVNGMNVSTYQLLSANAYTTMNLAFLGLPDWMPKVSTQEDANVYVAILSEHQEHIRGIDEATSEGYALLHLYRDFLSGNYFEPFFEFLIGYSSYLVSALGRSRFFVRPFTESNLRRLFEMSTDQKQYSPILQDEGFRNVANAIRSSTLIPIYQPTPLYTVRFGLGQDLNRKAQYKDDFIQALSQFMLDYNDETLRVRNRTNRQMRKLITAQDIESVVGLVDEYGARTVCNLLVAFGYARDPRDKSEESTETDEVSIDLDE